MSKNTEMERLLKLYALAMRGEGGEAANARAKLDMLLKRCGMTFADIEREAEAENAGGKREWVAFTLPKFEKGAPQVLAQLVFSFGLRKGNDSVSFRPNYASMRKRGVDCFVLLSPAEAALFRLFAAHCIRAFNRSVRTLRERQKQERLALQERHQSEREDVVIAFCSLNRLVSPKSLQESEEGNKTVEKPRKYSINWYDIEEFSHEHDRVLEDSRPQLEGGAV